MKRAFTVIELMIVLCICLILAALVYNTIGGSMCADEYQANACQVRAKRECLLKSGQEGKFCEDRAVEYCLASPLCIFH